MNCVTNLIGAALGLLAIPAFANVFDLAPNQKVELDVTVENFTEPDRTSKVFYRILNPYTNTLHCEIELNIPVLRSENREGVAEILLQDKAIFPGKAFDDTLEYPLDAANFPQGAKPNLSGPLVFEKKATCTGWKPEKRLPKKTCSTFNSNHAQSCIGATQSGLGYYFLIKNEQYLGMCGCP